MILSPYYWPSSRPDSVARVASWVLNGKKLRSVLLKIFLKPSPKTKVLSNRTFSLHFCIRQEMQKTHNILVVTLDNKHFLMDTGFGRRSPRSSFFPFLPLFFQFFLSRYPLLFSFTETEDVECCEGERWERVAATITKQHNTLPILKLKILG